MSFSSVGANFNSPSMDLLPGRRAPPLSPPGIWHLPQGALAGLCLRHQSFKSPTGAAGFGELQCELRHRQARLPSLAQVALGELGLEPNGRVAVGPCYCLISRVCCARQNQRACYGGSLLLPRTGPSPPPAGPPWWRTKPTEGWIAPPGGDGAPRLTAQNALAYT